MPGKKSADGRFLGPCEIAKKWTPYEISIVSVPADPTVGVGREMEGHSGRTREYFETQLKLKFWQIWKVIRALFEGALFAYKNTGGIESEQKRPDYAAAAGTSDRGKK